MLCPNCNKEMKPVYDRIWCQEDPDETALFLKGYCCKKCHINCDVFDNWELPVELQPTAKQVRAVSFISKTLYNMPLELPITKKDHIQFIGKYLSLAQLVRNQDSYEYDEGYGYDYYEEYF